MSTSDFMAATVSIGDNVLAACTFTATRLVANLVSRDESIPAVCRWWLPVDCQCLNKTSHSTNFTTQDRDFVNAGKFIVA